jgi:hypothetical protein
LWIYHILATYYSLIPVCIDSAGTSPFPSPSQTLDVISKAGNLIGVIPVYRPVHPAQTIAPLVLFEWMKEGSGHSQERKQTPTPTEYPAVSNPSTPVINPQASSKRQTLSASKSRNNTHVDRIAATVYSTVMINHTHR